MSAIRRMVSAAAVLAVLITSGCQGSEDPLMLAAREGKLDQIEAAVEGGTDLNTDFEPRKHSKEGGGDTAPRPRS